MATSIAEQIAVKVRTRLLIITTTGGFENTVNAVIRPKRTSNNNPKNYDVFVTQGTITRNEELSHPGNPPATAWVLPFKIAGTMRPSETLTTAIDTLKNQFWADCVKAINSGANWWTWDSLAIDSRIGDIEDYTADDGSAIGFGLNLFVTFRTDENNPFVLRG